MVRCGFRQSFAVLSLQAYGGFAAVSGKHSANNKEIAACYGNYVWDETELSTC